MSTDAKVAFLREVKVKHPALYVQALHRVLGRANLAGLGDDLTSDVSFDPGSYSLTGSDMAALNSAASSSGTDWGSIIDSFTNAVTSIAPAVVQTRAQLSTIQINAQRAQQGLPPLGQTSLMTGQGLGGNSMLLVGGLVVGGLLLLMASKHHG